jgi:hypothetical protein
MAGAPSPSPRPINYYLNNSLNYAVFTKQARYSLDLLLRVTVRKPEEESLFG